MSWSRESPLVEKICVECGSYFSVPACSIRSIRCKRCQDERTRELQAEREYIRRRREMGRDIKGLSLVVEFDPIPNEEGGLNGAHIMKMEWKEMQRMKVVSNGFRVRYPSGKIETFERKEL